jgi:hypothetical protein
MRPQARAFSVEIKGRKRATKPAVAAPVARRDDRIEMTPPDDLPQRYAPDDIPAHSEARREAERAFGRLGGNSELAQKQSDSESSVASASEPAPASPRVLPDLLTAVREQEGRPVQKARRKRAPEGSKAKRPKRKADQPLKPAPRLEPPSAVQSTVPPATSLPRRSKARASKLPPGQRWKQRRLPRVCWDR